MTPEHISNVQLTLWGLIGEIPGHNPVALRRVTAILEIFSDTRFAAPIRVAATRAHQSFAAWFGAGRSRTKRADEADARARVYADVWKLTDALRLFCTGGERPEIPGLFS